MARPLRWAASWVAGSSDSVGEGADEAEYQASKGDWVNKDLVEVSGECYLQAPGVSSLHLFTASCIKFDGKASGLARRHSVTTIYDHQFPGQAWLDLLAWRHALSTRLPSPCQVLEQQERMRGAR